MDAMEWMGSAMRAARAQLDVATHNLANAATDGFRKARADVALTARGLTVTAHATHEQGAVRTTGRPFDLALLGPGTFEVGRTRTRDGAFTRRLRALARIMHISPQRASQLHLLAIKRLRESLDEPA